MWSYSICDKGSITFYKNDNIIFQNNPYDNMLEVNIIKSIKYISELINNNNIENYDDSLEFKLHANYAMIELYNIWDNINL